jgi:hypothetical protein
LEEIREKFGTTGKKTITAFLHKEKKPITIEINDFTLEDIKRSMQLQEAYGEKI